VLIACPKCGAANDEHAQACYVCDAVYPYEEAAVQREPAVSIAAPRPRRASSRPRRSSKPSAPEISLADSAPAIEDAPQPAAAAPEVHEENPAGNAASPAVVEATPEKAGRETAPDDALAELAAELDKAFAPDAEEAPPAPQEMEVTAETSSSAAGEAQPVEVNAAAAAEAVEIEATPKEALHAGDAEESPAVSEPPPLEAAEEEEPVEVFGFARAVRELSDDTTVSRRASRSRRRDAEEEMSEPVPVMAGQEASRDSSARAPEPHRKVASFPAQEPEWRREVSRRLQNYRARRRNVKEDETQPQLPFQCEEPPLTPEDPKYRESLRIRSNARLGEPTSAVVVNLDEPPAPDSPVHATGLAEPEPHNAPAMEPESPAPADDTTRIEIPALQPDFQFVLSDDEDHPHAPLIPVAELRERSRALLIDLLCVGLAFAAFLGIFLMLGGRLSFGKPEATIFAATLFFFYGAYFALFTALGGATPGMYFRGLSAVNFDGTPAAPRALAWRSFGYLVSGATVIGFLWALWDEDHLTWHDRISQTYLTPAPSAMWRDFASTAFPEYDIPGYEDDQTT
jgi:uncharacterized RDD family membrane protein YckC